MTKPNITIALGYCDHVTDLVSGRVPINGVDANYVQFDRPAEIHFRFILYKDFDVAEISLGKYASMISQDQNDFVGLPVFTSRMARHSSIYIRKDRGIRSPEDLAGKRIGVSEWAQTAAIYVRGLLAHRYGVNLASIDWVQAGRIEKVGLRLPSGLRVANEPTRNLSDMMIDGEVDAVVSAFPPEAYTAGHPDITRLFEDYVDVEAAYFLDSGIFPIMHLVAVRKEILDKTPWIAMNLLQAFEQAKNNSVARMLAVSASSTPIPWAYVHARKQQALFGRDPWPYGVDANRKTLDAFLAYAYEQGVCHRRLNPEELFAERVCKRFSP